MAIEDAQKIVILRGTKAECEAYTATLKEGMVAFATDLNKFGHHDGTLWSWDRLDKMDATTAPTANDDSGDGYTVGSVWIDVTNDRPYLCVDATETAAVWLELGGGASTLDDLTDVVITSPASGEVLKYDGTDWVNDADAGGALNVQEIDGTPSVNNVTTIKVTNGTLTDEGGGIARMDFGSAATDGAAIHDNVAGEIHLIAEETTLADDDEFIFEKASVSYAKRRVKKSNLVAGGGGVVDVRLCNGRLTLESGVPVSTTDQTAKTTLYFTPYKGNRISLYDGSSAWTTLTFIELSLSLSGYTADKNYDIWAYNNSGSVALDSTVWTDDTTRATALALQEGVYVKSGTTTRRYLGTIRITATTGQCEDSTTNRYVWNYYNQLLRNLNSDGYTSHTYAGTTLRYWNNDTTKKVSFVIGVKVIPLKIALAALFKTGSASYWAAVASVLGGSAGGNFSTVDLDNGAAAIGAVAQTAIAENRATYYGQFTAFFMGYNFIPVMEVVSGNTGTFTHYVLIVDYFG